MASGTCGPSEAGPALGVRRQLAIFRTRGRERTVERSADEVAYGLRPATVALEECGRRCGLFVARLAGRGEGSAGAQIVAVCWCSTKELALCRSPRWSTPRLTTSNTARPVGRRVPMAACGLAKVFVLSLSIL